MAGRLKNVLNLHEAATEMRLRQVCERNGARVFAKVRLADVLPIESSGISDEHFKFALKSHLDFLVSAENYEPLFAVEFDGPSHDTDVQKGRDQTKDILCERFHLPLLRINSNYLRAKYRSMDLLSWFVEVWFASRGFDEAQQSGQIPGDEPFMPMSIISIPGRKGTFPLWLSAPIRTKIQKYFFAGQIKDLVPSVYVGQDSAGTYRAVAFIRVTADSGVLAETAMRFQQFPVSRAEALDELVVFDLSERLEAVLAGTESAVAMDNIVSRLKHIQASHVCRFAYSDGGAAKTLNLHR